MCEPTCGATRLTLMMLANLLNVHIIFFLHFKPLCQTSSSRTV